MSVLEHLDELRVRLVRALLAYLVALGLCWFASGEALDFLLRPIRRHLDAEGDITFLTLTEPFVVRMKAAALMALFLATPYVLWELWGFVSPGLYRRERRLAVPFLFFGSLAFFAGGAFGYYVAVPRAAAWLLELGQGWRAAITLGSAFTFESRIIVAMGAVFELPMLIFFLARLGVVTPRQLLRQFRVAVLVIAVAAAVVTPTGDMITMSLFVVPMVLLYLLGVGVAWFATPREAPEAGS
jgi:sec-independent protein translocase protein TatC